jgi:endonuclease-8
VDPWRPTGTVSDDEALAVVSAARTPMLTAATLGHTDRAPQVYGRAGRPCPRCGARIRDRGQGDDNRRTFWCPRCQR